MSEQAVLDKLYDPRSVEPEIFAFWERSGAFRSHPTDPPTPHDRTFTIVMPPPNVTGALHLGHALNNTLQDILIRYHRMRGFNTLWQPGTDHAGIATQAVVERRIRETEGKSRHDLGREELVRRIWQWKDEYEKRIIGQLKLMGCSCDWERCRFTLDEGLARAVRHQFFKMFKDGLIFRGKRLVNWDTQLQTAVSDDEVYYESVKGHFWHFKYPVIAKASHEATKPRRHEEPEYVVIATTRPETMLGDTAVAVHPDPEGFLNAEEGKLREALVTAAGKDRTEIEAKLVAIAERRQSHLPQLIKLRDMARAGRKLRLPLVAREIPLIADEWADPLLGSGCVKITPAHDPNDYQVGLRHNLPMINVLTADGKVAKIMEPDGSANAHSNDYEGLPFNSEGRAKVVADMESRCLVEAIEDRDIEVGHSDRSKLPIEPYLSDQWYVRTAEIEGFEIADREHKDVDFSRSLIEAAAIPDRVPSNGLADAAMLAVNEGRVRVFPERYAKTYLDWLGEKRDWCISRQLWWGHRIPIWTKSCSFKEWLRLTEGPFHSELFIDSTGPTFVQVTSDGTQTFTIVGASDSVEQAVAARDAFGKDQPLRWTVCCDEGVQEFGDWDESKKDFNRIAFDSWLESNGFERDPDVLDTWFSSCLWPFSTLGWPEETPHLKQYYPGSVLCTSRDIITLWVVRMMMSGLYLTGKVPFDHVYIHPKILDGRGETMSKSKGNGVDPVDMIQTHGADALRYSMADLTTETQDIRMPVDYLCPHCGKLTDQGVAIKNEEQNRKSRGEKLERKLQPSDCAKVKCSHRECGKEFATQWADAELKQKLGLGRESSEKFEIGRNFCNKLWNAARFAFMNLENAAVIDIKISSLPPEDKWILARLSQTIRRYHECLATYQFAASVKELRDFFWDSLCDWYLELTKPRFSSADGADGGTARQVLAFCLDQTLRLWHPTIPFITERLWRDLNAIAPRRGLPPSISLKTDVPLISAEFPPLDGYPAFDDDRILSTFGALQDATRGVRELRSDCKVAPKERVTVTVVLPGEQLDSFQAHSHIVRHMAGIGELNVVTQGKRPANAGSVTVKGLRIYVHDVSDDAAEQVRTAKTLEGVARQIAAKESKLGNAKFTANADSEVVAAERLRLFELLEQRATLQEHLSELGE